MAKRADKQEGPHSEEQSGPAEPAVSDYAGVTYRQGQAIEALLQGQPMNKAALAAGVSPRGLRKWLHKPRSRAALFGARREAFSQAIGLTQRYAPVAVATLVKVMNDNLAPSSARVTAAAILLKFGREGIELDDLASRVEVLERAASVMAAHPGQRMLRDES